MCVGLACSPTIVTSRCLAKKRPLSQLSRPENRYAIVDDFGGNCRWYMDEKWERASDCRELVLLYGAAESLWIERDESNDEPWV
jgi:hypothetical protein